MGSVLQRFFSHSPLPPNTRAISTPIRLPPVKPTRKHTLAALVGGLLLSHGAQAAIIGINRPASSIAQINFDDTFSSAPPNGVTNAGPLTTSWNGSALTLLTLTDPNTGDFAKGDIVGSFTQTRRSMPSA